MGLVPTSHLGQLHYLKVDSILQHLIAPGLYLSSAGLLPGSVNSDHRDTEAISLLSRSWGTLKLCLHLLQYVFS